ncbi:MAG: minichromosome maintenance protein MCM, partial [Nanoarchaeota archaeon]|nr:minichromosome maintenance protein MCM [Nanoarchaeota archaeon]
NVQTIVGSEIPEDIAGDQQPEQIPMMLDDDLTKKFNRKNTQPGKKLIVSGVLLEKKIKLKSGETSTTFDYVFDVNSIESLDESELDIDVSKEDIIAIKEFAKQPDAMNKLINMIAPSIYGCKPQKETILHILAGGIRRVKPDGSIKRGDMHGLLAGEPGLAKSDLLLRAKIIAHKARYVSGKGTSGVGITASVIKDDILGGWALEAGAMVLANKGFVMIDELDKMGAEDRSYLHEALEQQTITISKANIQATLRCETTAIAACNPKNNLFNDHELNFSKQLDIPSSLLNRFDIILKIRDIVDSKKDGKLVKHIFNSFREISEKDLDKRLNQLRTKEDIFLKKFLSYVRTLIPIWTKEAEELIEAWYVHARDKREPDSLPINPRQVHAVVRLAESDAKIRIDEKITIAHVKEAIRLMEYSLIQIGCLNSDTGRFSMDSILGSDCDLRIIGNIIMKMDAPSMSLDYIIDEAKAKGITEDTTLKKIEKLKRSGNIFEPKPGQIMKV